MISIFKEIRAIETGEADKEDNAPKRAPHTAQDLATEPWGRSYSRESAAFPAAVDQGIQVLAARRQN